MIANILIRLASYSLQKCLMLGLLLCGIYYVVGYNSGEDLQKNLATFEQKLQEEKIQEKKSDESLREVELVRATIGELGQQFQTVSNALPRTIEYAEITRIVDFIARKSGVSIKSRESRPEVNRDYFSEVPIKVTVEGSYSELVYFMSLLAQTVRVMKLIDFSIYPPTFNGMQPIRHGKLLLDGEIISYKFNEKKSGPNGQAVSGQNGTPQNGNGGSP